MESPVVDFLKFRWITAVLSIILVCSSIGLYIFRGGFRYSVDFTGGTQVLLGFKSAVSPEKVKQVVEDAGWPGAATRDFSEDGKTQILVRVQAFSNDAKGLGERIKTELNKDLKDNEVVVLSTDSVGPGVGEYLRTQSLMAILIALLAMLLYIAFRFQASFSIGAVVALAHDALAILTAFLLFDKEISIDVLGAILATLGYSVNDTIVIFSRIRENLKANKHDSLYDVVNMSLGQTFKRTMLTSLSTALAVGSLFVLGGQTLRDLSFALLIGIVVGTYSSIYVASSVMLLLYKKFQRA